VETVTVNRQLAWLTTQHERMLGIVDGLIEKQLRTARPSSLGWTPVGMLVHVREATRFWLAEILLGDTPPSSSLVTADARLKRVPDLQCEVRLALPP